MLFGRDRRTNLLSFIIKAEKRMQDPQTARSQKVDSVLILLQK